MNLLVTGGAGYIGSHTVRALQCAGYRPIVLDNLVYGHRRIVEEVLQVPLVVGQVGDRALLDAVLDGSHPACAGEPVRAVLHFAAYAYVGESMADPAKYYRNNLADSLVLLEALADPVRLGTGPAIPIVFSSTCASYGIPETMPISESTPQRPINPYGRSKWMVEQLLADFGRSYGLPSVIFRYFNAAGADPAGDLGEDHTPETHLIPLVLEAMAGRRGHVQIFGDDYPTPDGTCIRDYIHVSDLADAHVLGLQKLLANASAASTEADVTEALEPLIYNLGTGTGYSVQEVLDAARRVTGHGLLAHVAKRRDGDPPVLVASAEKAQRELGWRPRYSNLETILSHAWTWHQRHWQEDASEAPKPRQEVAAGQALS